MSVHPTPQEVRARWDFEDPAASEQRLRSASVEGPSDVWTTQIARAIGLQGRCEEALALLDALEETDAVVGAWAALERGRILRTDGDATAAAPWFARALTAAEESRLEYLAVDALHMLALIASPADILDAHVRALQAARTASDPYARTWEASILTNIGMVHADQGQWSAALARFEEARSAASTLPDADERLLVADWMVAWALRHLGRSEEARSRQLELKERLHALGRVDPYVEEELALLEADQTRS